MSVILLGREVWYFHRRPNSAVFFFLPLQTPLKKKRIIIRRKKYLLTFFFFYQNELNLKPYFVPPVSTSSICGSFSGFQCVLEWDEGSCQAVPPQHPPPPSSLCTFTYEYVPAKQAAFVSAEEWHKQGSSWGRWRWDKKIPHFYLSDERPLGREVLLFLKSTQPFEKKENQIFVEQDCCLPSGGRLQRCSFPLLLSTNCIQSIVFCSGETSSLIHWGRVTHGSMVLIDGTGLSMKSQPHDEGLAYRPSTEARSLCTREALSAQTAAGSSQHLSTWGNCLK